MSNWTLKEKSVGDLVVTIEGAEWKKAVVKAFNKLAKNVVLDGFRKGSAPKALLEKRISAGERYMQAIEDNANDWMRKALEEEGLKPISQPQLDVRSVDADKAELVYTFAVEPEIEISDYKGLDYPMDDVTVSDEDIDEEIERMRNTYAEMEVKDGAAEEGDTVNINYKGFKDGIAFAGGEAENYDLVLGSGSFIPGFEEQLIGAKAGEEKDLNLTFPEDYHAEDLKGAAVVFKVTVNEVKTKVLPEVNDEFAQDINAKDVKTVADLREMVRSRIEERRKSEAESKADNALGEQLVAKVNADLPDVLIDDEVKGQINQLVNQLQQYGMSLTGYLQMMGQTAEQLNESYREGAIKTVKMRLALAKIAELENIVPTEEEIEKEYQNIADMYQMPLEDVKKYIDPEMLKNDLKNQRAYDFVKENAKR